MDQETRLALSLDGATRGRRIGFRTAQQKAAQIALNAIKDTEEATKVYNLIMDLQDAAK